MTQGMKGRKEKGVIEPRYAYRSASQAAWDAGEYEAP